MIVLLFDKVKSHFPLTAHPTDTNPFDTKNTIKKGGGRLGAQEELRSEKELWMTNNNCSN